MFKLVFFNQFSFNSLQNLLLWRFCICNHHFWWPQLFVLNSWMWLFTFFETTTMYALINHVICECYTKPNYLIGSTSRTFSYITELQPASTYVVVFYHQVCVDLMIRLFMYAITWEPSKNWMWLFALLRIRRNMYHIPTDQDVISAVLKHTPQLCTPTRQSVSVSI